MTGIIVSTQASQQHRGVISVRINALPEKGKVFSYREEASRAFTRVTPSSVNKLNNTMFEVNLYNGVYLTLMLPELECS